MELRCHIASVNDPWARSDAGYLASTSRRRRPPGLVSKEPDDRERLYTFRHCSRGPFGHTVQEQTFLRQFVAPDSKEKYNLHDRLCIGLNQLLQSTTLRPSHAVTVFHGRPFKSQTFQAMKSLGSGVHWEELTLVGHKNKKI